MYLIFMLYTYKQFILRVPTVDNVSNGHFKKCSYRSIEILLELPPSYSGFFWSCHLSNAANLRVEHCLLLNCY